MSHGLRFLCLALLLASATLRAQESLVRNPIPNQAPGTVYLVNEGEEQIQFSLSYTARNWNDYELRTHHACIIPVEEFGYSEVVIRFVEKPGIERTLKLEANERYQFVYRKELRRWELKRLR